MALDSRGVYTYTEDDDEATFSELLNLGMRSISDALAYFAGTSAERMACVPAPPGAMWQDTDNGGRLWSTGPDGSWRLHTGEYQAPVAPWTVTNTAPVYSRQFTAILPTVLAPTESILVTALSTGTGYGVISLANVIRHVDRTEIAVRFSGFSATTQSCLIAWQVFSK